MFYQPVHNYSAVYILAMDLLLIVPPILLWYVIFYLPKKYGIFNLTAIMRKKLKLTEASGTVISMDIHSNEDFSQITRPFISGCKRIIC